MKRELDYHWTHILPDDTEAYRRAGGRRRYNARRRATRNARRRAIAHVCITENMSPFAHGNRAYLARVFDVHRSTISRDIEWLFGWRSWPDLRLERVCDALRRAGGAGPKEQRAVARELDLPIEDVRADLRQMKKRGQFECR